MTGCYMTKDTHLKKKIKHNLWCHDLNCSSAHLIGPFLCSALIQCALHDMPDCWLFLCAVALGIQTFVVWMDHKYCLLFIKGRNWLCESQRHERLDAPATPTSIRKHYSGDLHPGRTAIIKVQSKADDESKSQQHKPAKSADERRKIRDLEDI